MCQISLPTPARLRLRFAGRRVSDARATEVARAPDAACVAAASRAFDATRITFASASGRGPTLRTTGASDLSRALGGVLLGYSQRSAMMHFGHAGTRATHT